MLVRPGAGGGADTRRLDRDQCLRRDPAGENSGPGHTIVTILADSGTRYQSKLFNPAFLKERDLPTPPWMEGVP